AVRVEIGCSGKSIAVRNGWHECATDKRGAGQIPDCRLTGTGIEEQIIGFVIPIGVRHADHSPVNGQSWTKDAADKNVVIEVPNRGLPISGRIQHIIGLTVRVEIAHCYKIPIRTVRKTRAEGAANKGRSRQIPDCRLTGAGIEKQVIGPAVTIEVCHTDYFPASWKSWTIGAANKGVVVEIPNPCLVCAGIVKKIIGLAIAIKVRHTNDYPANRKRGSRGAGDKSIVVQVPDRRACRPWCFYLKREVLVRAASPPPYVGTRCYA